MSVFTDILGSLGLAKPAPLSPFPPQVPDPISIDTKLQNALLTAIHNAETQKNQAANSFPIAMMIVDITKNSGTFPAGGWSEWEEDYIASEAKVGILYAAYAFRDMVQRYVDSKGSSNLSTVLAQIGADMNADIVSSVPALQKATNLTNVQRVPTYQNVVTATASATGLTVGFTPAYDTALNQMIVPSDNGAARDCIHGLGYSYVNGALAAGGYFDPGAGQGPSPGPGVWVAGDYQKGTVWPYARLVTSANDGAAAYAATPHAIARLMVAIATKQAIDSQSSTDMLSRLSQAVSGPDAPFLSRNGVSPNIQLSQYLGNKIGYGPLNKGGIVTSECGVIKDLAAAGRTYVAVWQNLKGTEVNNSFVPALYSYSDVATIILDTVAQYEA